MTIYGIEEYGGSWEDSWSRIRRAFVTKGLAEKYKDKAEAQSQEIEIRIEECNRCSLYYDCTDDDGKMVVPIKKAKSMCPRATIDDDGWLTCYEAGIWGVPRYNIIEIELIEEEAV